MRQSLIVPVFVVFSSLGVNAAAPPAPAAPSPTGEIVDHYLTAVEAQRQHSPALSMEVNIDASLPRLKKQGKLHAFRFITRLGRIFYDRPDYVGDNTVKKEVIARYLQAESQARTEYAGALAITPENYRFKYKGTTDYAGKTAYVLQVQPRKKRVGLFRGELWVDKDTYLPLREWGELAKNPSVFLKNVYFVRDYMIWDGMSVPRRLISDVDTRLVGKAQLTVWFDHVKVGDQVQQVAGGGADTHVTLADGTDR